MSDNPEKSASSRRAGCKSCPEKQLCKSICENVESMLPSINKGKVAGHRLNESDLAPGISRYEEAKLLLKNKNILSRRQRQVVKLFYQRGLKLAEIAKKLKIGLTTAAFHRTQAIKKIYRLFRQGDG